MSEARWLARSERWFRLLMRLYPADFRKEMGEALVETYRDRCRGALSSGVRSLMMLWLRALSDSLRNGLVERLGARRGARRGRLAPFSWLDFKLGLRMLVRYPGLTLVGGLAMAFAIATGAAFFEFVSQLVYPELPLDEGDRIVALRTWDAAASRAQPTSYGDFVAWRDRLETVEDVGAWSPLEGNLGIGEATWERCDLRRSRRRPSASPGSLRSSGGLSWPRTKSPERRPSSSSATSSGERASRATPG